MLVIEVHIMNFNKEKTKPEYGSTPNTLLYFLVCRLSKIFLKFKYKINIENSTVKYMKPPFIVLGNHPSSLDPFIIASSLYPHKINFLGTNFYFRNPILRPILRLGGIIPKVQAFKDTRAVRMMNKVISRGGILGICPEGRRSTDGSQYPINDAIAKLIKLYSVPVAAVVSHGAYLSLPRWSAFSHKGSIEVSVKEILTVEQIKKLSIEEIKHIVCSSLNYNDYEWNKVKNISYKHNKMAENIHFVLHECPSCGREKTMVSKNNRFYCSMCGNSALMDEYGLLHPESSSCIIFEDAPKWLNWQRQRAYKRVQNLNFSITSKVIKLRIADCFTGPYYNSGSGDLLLNPEGLIFKGTINSHYQELFFPLQVLSSISSEFGSNFEITDGKNTYCFFLEDGQDIIRIELAIMQLISRN